MPMRAVRPLACSLAIHLGLGVIAVFAGAADWRRRRRRRGVARPGGGGSGTTEAGHARGRLSAPDPSVLPPSNHKGSQPKSPWRRRRNRCCHRHPLERRRRRPQRCRARRARRRRRPSRRRRRHLEPDSGGAPSSPRRERGRLMESRPPRSASRVADSRHRSRRPGRPGGTAEGRLSGASRLPGIGEARRRPGDDPAAHSHRDRWTRQRRERRAIGRTSSLDEAAADAVRRWRFEPALNAAGPVSMWAVVPVEFRIGDRDWSARTAPPDRRTP